MNRFVVAVVALAFPPVVAPAHDPERDEPPRFEEQIEVVGHYQNRVGTTDAASAGTVTSTLIEDRPILRPGEVLELVPGLVITQHSGAGKANQYYLRGFNLDHGTDFLTTLDGIPVNLRTHAHGQGYTDLNFVLPELIQRVDYVKGPYYAAKGDFASAGAADIHYAEDLLRSLVSVTAGTYGYARVVALGSPHVAGGHLLYGFEFMHEDGPWTRPDDYRRWNGVLRYAHPLGGGTIGATAMLYVGNWNATDQVPRRAIDAGIIGRFGTLDPTTAGSSHRYSLSGNLEHPLGGGVLRASAYAVRYDLDLFSNFTYFLVDPQRGDQFEQHDERWVLGSGGSWSVTGKLGPVDAHGLVGWEFRYDHVDPVGLYHTAARERLETVRQDRVNETSGAVYAQIDNAWTPWLRTVLGARFDQYWFHVSSSDPRNGGQVTANRASPKASAILGPWAKTEVFLNLGYGFHSNDARGVTTTVDPASGTPVRPVTPLVQTRGYELGVRTEILPGVQTSVALWRLDLDSELLFTGDAGTTEPSRPSRRQGLEWSARWNPLRWLLLDVDVALSSARFTDPDPVGAHVPGAIGSAVSAGVTIHDLGPVSASVFVRYFGPRPLIEDDSVRSGASTLFNAQVQYRITRSWAVTVDVFNLFDAAVDDIAYFYASRLPGEPAEGVNDVHFHPAEKRSVRVGVSFSY